MLKQLVIIGTGGSALDVLDIVEAINDRQPTWEVAGFLDDVKPTGSIHCGCRVIGPIRSESPPRDERIADSMFVNVIGSDRNYHQRQAILASSGIPPERFATLIHPSAVISSRARLGYGVCVNAFASVGGNVHVGDQVWLGVGCVVGHDTTIGDFSIVAPGAVLSGFVRVGPSCYVGSRSAVRQRVGIGEAALVGLGAAVVADVPPAAAVVGVPARPMSGYRAGGPSMMPIDDLAR